MNRERNHSPRCFEMLKFRGTPLHSIHSWNQLQTFFYINPFVVIFNNDFIFSNILPLINPTCPCVQDNDQLNKALQQNINGNWLIKNV